MVVISWKGLTLSYGLLDGARNADGQLWASHFRWNLEDKKTIGLLESAEVDSREAENDVRGCFGRNRTRFDFKGVVQSRSQWQCSKKAVILLNFKMATKFLLEEDEKLIYVTT